MQNNKKTTKSGRLSKPYLKTDRPAIPEQVPLKKASRQPAPLRDNVLLFDLRRSPTNPDVAYVRGFIRVGRKATKPFNTGITVPVGTFDPATGTVTGDEHKTDLLHDLRVRANRLFVDFRLTNRLLDAKDIQDALISDGTIIEKTHSLQSLIDAWIIRDYQRYEAKQIVERTMWKNRRWANDFWAFAQSKYNKDVVLTQIKPADSQAFVLWLITVRNLQNNVAMSTVSHARTILEFAVDSEWLVRNPFTNFRRKMEDVERVTLSKDEMLCFCTFQLESKALTAVRDAFYLMCLTALNYTDLRKLTIRDIRKSDDGTPYLRIKRQKMISRKNTVPATIPLSPVALALIEQYYDGQADSPLIRMQENAPFNRGLKQIAAMAGIEKSVTSKVARNSIADYLLNIDVSLPSISAMLGHSNVLTTQKSYVKSKAERIIADMKDVPFFNPTTEGKDQ